MLSYKRLWHCYLRLLEGVLVNTDLITVYSNFPLLISYHHFLVCQCGSTGVLIGMRFDPPPSDTSLGNTPQGLVLTCRTTEVCTVFFCTQSCSCQNYRNILVSISSEAANPIISPYFILSFYLILDLNIRI